MLCTPLHNPTRRWQGSQTIFTKHVFACNSSSSLPNWNFPNLYHSIQNQAIFLFCHIDNNIWRLRPLSLVILLSGVKILQVKQRSQYTIVFGDQCKWICSILYWIFLPTLPLSPRKLLKSYKAQMANMFQQGLVSSLLFLFWPWFNNLPRLQVMTVGPFRPVLSWIWDIFSAIAIRGLSTA